jgi:hypothetical protein
VALADQNAILPQMVGDEDSDEEGILKWSKEGGEVDAHSDLRVRIADRIYHCHAALLARESKYFDRLLKWKSNANSVGSSNTSAGTIKF